MQRIDPQDRRRALAAIARSQAGYFTASQALKAGYSYQAQRYHADHGNWQRVDRGIFRLPEWPASEHEDLVRWTLWSRDRAVVSHQSALALHELGVVMPTKVHLTVPPGFRAKAPGVVIHKGSLPKEDVEDREGFRVTTPIRSILDAASKDIESDHLARVIEDALERGLTTRRVIRSRADEFGPATALAIERALLQEVAT
jgi:predicted transcriptional regulator of viral defense system